MKSLKEFIIESQIDINKEITKILAKYNTELSMEPTKDEWWGEYDWAWFDDSESYVTDAYGLFMSNKLPKKVSDEILAVTKKYLKTLTSNKLVDNTDADAKRAGYNTYICEF